METVAVVRPEYRGEGQLQDPRISVDSEEVGQGEVSLLGGDLSVLRPVQLAPPAPTEDILRAGPGEHPLVGQVAVRLLQGRATVGQVLSSQQVSSLSDEVGAVPGQIPAKSGELCVLAWVWSGTFHQIKEN